MEKKTLLKQLLWILLLFTCFLYTSAYSDLGKMSSSQNYFGSGALSQFTTKNNTRVIAQKGGLAVLPCVVKINSPATVSWIRRKDFQLLTVGLSTHSSDKRFLVEHTRHMGHWSLRIKSVREEDRGFYECQLAIYPTQSIFIELRVVEAVAEITGAPDLHIDETSTLRLECKLKRATENPAFVFWYHDNKMVNYDTMGGFSVNSVSVTESNSHDISSPLPSGIGSLLKVRENFVNYISDNSTNIPLSSMLAQFSQVQLHSTYLLIPSMSILTIKEVHFNHAGNYTCAPSNARPASITVHVLRGERSAAMQHANRSILDGEGSNNTISMSGVTGNSGASDLSKKAFIGVNISIPLFSLINTHSQYFNIQSALIVARTFFKVLSYKR